MRQVIDWALTMTRSDPSNPAPEEWEQFSATFSVQRRREIAHVRGSIALRPLMESISLFCELGSLLVFINAPERIDEAVGTRAPGKELCLAAVLRKVDSTLINVRTRI